MKLKGEPIKLFWENANCWRKLSLLRLLGKIKIEVAQKYLMEMRFLQNEDGGFAREKGEASSVSVTADAIINLVQSGDKPNPLVVKRAVAFLWSLQKENGSWHENPNLAKDKVPFWSSTEKGVPILTADVILALAEAGYKNNENFVKAVDWLKSMQSKDGMWIYLEDAEPSDVDPDSTYKALEALVKVNKANNSLYITSGCKALKKFILTEAAKWTKKWPVWSWMAPLDGLVAAGYDSNNEVVKHVVNKILEQQQENGGWPGGYEVRVVPTLITLGLISKKESWQKIIEIEESSDITK